MLETSFSLTLEPRQARWQTGIYRSQYLASLSSCGQSVSFFKTSFTFHNWSVRIGTGTGYLHSRIYRTGSDWYQCTVGICVTKRRTYPITIQSGTLSKNQCCGSGAFLTPGSGIRNMFLILNFAMFLATKKSRTTIFFRPLLLLLLDRGFGIWDG